MSHKINHLYEFGHFRLDVEDRLLLRDGESVPLTPKAYDLLLTLVKRQGRLLEKDELLKLVWPDTFIEEGNLSYNISLIRKALGDGENGLKFIETMPKRGYRFVAEVREVQHLTDREPQLSHGTKLDAETIAPVMRRVSMFNGRPTKRNGWPDFSIAWIAAGVFALLAVVTLGFAYFKGRQPESQVVRFTQFVPEITNLVGAGFAISPNGQLLAFPTADATGKIMLYLRPLNSFSTQALPNTENARLPFWSPDSRSIGFFSEDKLKRIDLSGGPSQTLCEAKNFGGGTWNRAGDILFSRESVLYRVPAKGGVPSALTTLDATREERFQGFPQFLPDGEHFLYFSGSRQPAHTGIYVGSVSGNVTKLVLNTEHTAVYASSYLLFSRNNVLMGQAFDITTWKLMGEAFPISGQVKFYDNSAKHMISASENGVLAFQGGTGQSPQLIWYDRTGRRLGSLGEPADYSNPSLSPDNKRLAVGIRDPITRKRDIWLFDLARGAKSRFTSDAADDLDPAWSNDGSKIFFTSDRKGQRDLYEKKVDAAGEGELLYTSPEIKNVNDLSPDGRWLIYDLNPDSKSKTKNDLWLLPLEGERQPQVYLQTQFNEDQSAISPDGRWVAYTSEESGKYEVYVATFPQPDRKWQVSVAGGAWPRWRQDGKELFFNDGDTKLMAVEVKTSSGSFETGVPKLLFQAPFNINPGRNRYVVTRDGQRFLVIARLEDTAAAPLNVVVNWLAEVKR